MPVSSSAPWRKFYGDMPYTINYPRITMYQLVAQTAKRVPGLCAYEFMNRKTSFSAFLRRVDRAAAALYALGIRKGERVTICMPNTPQAVDCFYALSRIGAVSNMVHPLSATEEITFYLNLSDSKAILTLDRLYGKVTAAIAGAKRKPLVLIARIQDELSPPMKLGFALTQSRKLPKLPKSGGYLLWKDVTRLVSTELPEPDEDYGACASILYSGGTTGTTKGICLSSYNFNALALQTIAASGYPSLEGLKCCP